jgi:hypothetical protein
MTKPELVDAIDKANRSASSASLRKGHRRS